MTEPRQGLLHAYHVSDGTYRYMVLATNVDKAIALLRCSKGDYYKHGGRYPDGSVSYEIANQKSAGTVWRKPLAQRSNQWGPFKFPQ